MACETLSGKVVLITGASSGIGQACAIEFAKWKCRVVITGRDMDKLKETEQKCMDTGLPQDFVYKVTGDVTVAEDVQKIVDYAYDRYGKINILMNVAGATRARTLETCTVEDLDWCYNVLVRSVFLMTQATKKHLVETKGTIINMSSLSALRPLTFAVPYSMCKCMVDRFTQICSLSLAEHGVNVISINPATVRTPMFERSDGLCGTDDKVAKYIDWCNKAIPSGRICEMWEVGSLAAFLASECCKPFSGISFPLDGSLSNTSFHPGQ